MSDPYDLSSGGKGLKVQPCHCPYHRKLREEEAQGPRPGWLQREFDASRKAAALPAAGPWVKIEPGCEMPNRRTPLLVKDEELGQPRFVIGYCVDDEFYSPYGKRIKQATHYAPINPPVKDQ